MASTGSGVLNACINCRTARLQDSRFGARLLTACRSDPQQQDPRTLATFHPRRARRALLALRRRCRLRPRCLPGTVVFALPRSSGRSPPLPSLLLYPPSRYPQPPAAAGLGYPRGGRGSGSGRCSGWLGKCQPLDWGRVFLTPEPAGL